MSSDKSLEELMNIASQQTKEKIDVVDLSEAQKFALSKGIKAGETRIQAGLIYDMYKEWADKTAVQRNKFFTQFAKLFPKGRGTNYYYYLLNPEPFNLDDNQYRIQQMMSAAKKTTNDKSKEQKEKDPSKE